MKSIVLVTEPEYRKGEDRFTAARGLDCRPAPAAEDDLAAVVRDLNARYVIVGGRPYTGPLYDALPAGGVIARFGVGHDGIDKTRATARGRVVHQHAFRSRSVGGRARHASRGGGRTKTHRGAGEYGQRPMGFVSGPGSSGQDDCGDWVWRHRPRAGAHRRAWLRDACCRLHQAGCSSTASHRPFRARDERFRRGGPRRRFRQPAYARKAGERRVHQRSTSRRR